MNWGHKIAILYTSFAVFMLFLVVKTFYNKSELVTPDYYKEELAFQTKLNKLQNAEDLGESINYQITNDSIQFKFPSIFRDQKIDITANFLNPSNSKKDKQLNFLLGNDATGNISVSNIEHGYYKVNLAWQHNNKEYMKEIAMTIK